MLKWPITVTVSITQKMNQDFDDACKAIGYTRLYKTPIFESKKKEFESHFMTDCLRCIKAAANLTNTVTQQKRIENIAYQMLQDSNWVARQENLYIDQLVTRFDNFAKYIKGIVVVEQQIGEMRSILSQIKQLETNTLVKTEARIIKSTLKQEDKLLLKDLAMVKKRLNEYLDAQSAQQIPKNVNTAIIRTAKRQYEFIQQAPAEKERSQRQKLQRSYDEDRKRLKFFMDSLKDLLAINIPQLQNLNEKIISYSALLKDDKALLHKMVEARIKFLRMEQRLSRSPNRMQTQARKPINSNSKPSNQTVRHLQKEKEALYKGQNNQKYEKMQSVVDKMTKQIEQLRRHISHNQRQISDLRAANDTFKRELLQYKQEKAKEVSIPKAQNSPSSQPKLAQIQDDYERKLKNMRINEKSQRSSYAALEKMIELMRQQAAKLSSQLSRYRNKIQLMAYDQQRLKKDYDNLRKDYQLLLAQRQGGFSGRNSKGLANSSQDAKDKQMFKMKQELSLKEITLSAVSQKFHEAITMKQQRITSLQLFIQQMHIKLNKNDWSHSALPK